MLNHLNSVSVGQVGRPPEPGGPGGPLPPPAPGRRLNEQPALKGRAAFHRTTLLAMVLNILRNK